MTIKNSILAGLAALMLAACSTINDARDGLAGFIETDARQNRPDRVRLVPEYIPIPEQYLTDDACPPPVSLTPQEIARITTEGEYNEFFVAPLYANNEECYLNTRRIERFNQSQIDANNINKDEANER